MSNENNEIVDKVLSGARWATGLRLAGQAISWLSTIIVVRFISPEDYGLNAMVEAPLELLALLCTFGLDLALVRSKHIEEHELRSAFGWLLLINGALFLAYFFGSGLIASYFHEPRLEPRAKVLAFIFLLTPFRVIPNALLDRNLKFKLRAAVELVAGVCSAVATLLLALWGAGVWALVIGVLINRILLAIILMILQPWFIMPSLSFSAARGMMIFGGKWSLLGVVVLITDKLATLIGAPILGAEALGIFAVTFQFALLPLAKLMPVINTIIFPAFSKFQDQPDVAAYYLGRALRIISLGLFPIMIGLACVSEGFVATVLGERWSGVILPLALLSSVMPFRMATSLLRPVLGSMGRPDLALKSAVIGFMTLLPLMFIGTHYGVLGMVVALMISELIVAFVTIGMSKVVLGTSVTKVAECFSPAIVSSLVMAACLFGIRALSLNGISLGDLFIEVALGALVYFLTLRIFYEKLLQESIKLVLGRRNAGYSA
ncbi:MAG TPA: lipopolysaccharide biosynthesis protein [Nitrosospira sp.]|nr:lipopolysaccharide biosynthesis protein [Nitrosospira sp.]